ncbi:MAG: DUF3800 domain-containing protein [Candidatus Sericytochromatia bacterium]
MKTYNIYIDETGSFYKSKDKNTNFVGGWVSSNFNKNNFFKKIAPKIDEINQIICNDYNDDKLFNIKKDLHYVPLHFEDRRIENDSHIKVPTEKVPEIIQFITDSVFENVDFIFNSTGFPSYFINEQSSYFEILHSTIFQILDEPIFENKDIEEINLFIASRRTKKVLGDKIYNNLQEYETNICNKISEEIKNIFKYKGFSNKIKIKIIPADQIFELQLADIFIGCIRDKKYIEKYANDKIKQYNIHNAFKYQPKRYTQEIENIFEYDKISALLLAFEYISSDNKKNKNELEQLIIKLFSKISEKEEVDFYQELKNYLESKIIRDSLKYENLDFIENFIFNIKNKINLIKNNQIKAKITFILEKNYIKIHSHNGKISINEIDNYFKLIEENQELIFNNIYELFQERIETKLKSIPIFFNRLEFNSWENKLQEEFDLYKKITDLTKQEVKKDSNLAKISGTLGQAYAFLYNFNKDKDYFDLAEQYIKEDIEYCNKNTSEYYKALGYLVSLYFKKDDLEKAEDYFLLETNSQDKNKDLIYNLSKIDNFNFNDPFCLLHRIYLCALAQKLEKKEILGLSSFADNFIKNKNVSKYPNFLTGKWLGVLLLNNNENEKANIIFDSILEKYENDEYIIKLIKLPIFLLNFYTKKLLETKINTNFEKEVILPLEKELPNTIQKLKELGFYDLLDKENLLQEDLYKISSIMPFYYS